MGAERLPAPKRSPLCPELARSGDPWQGGAVSVGPIWHGCIAIPPLNIDTCIINMRVQNMDLILATGFYKFTKFIFSHILVMFVTISCLELSDHAITTSFAVLAHQPSRGRKSILDLRVQSHDHSKYFVLPIFCRLDLRFPDRQLIA